MRTTYDVRHTHAGDEVIMTERIADTVLSVYGARCKLSISTIIIPRSEALGRARPFTAIRFAYRPLLNNDDRYGWEGCALRGMIRVADASTGVRRQVEQALVPYRPVHLSILDFTDMTECGAPLGRRIVRTTLRRYESLLEYSRRSIRNGFADHVRDGAIRFAQRAYGHATVHAASMLGTLDWPQLLEGSDCGSECLSTIENTTIHNQPHFLELIEDDEMVVEPLCRNTQSQARVIRNIRHQVDMIVRQEQRAKRDAEYAASTTRAIELMGSVCGKAVATEFTKDRCVTLEQNGYEFTLSPDGMICCWDPDGKRARLCIHTEGFCCHPIDEIIIAYLNIRHGFSEFMRTANVFRRERGFRMPAFKPTAAPAHG